MSAIADDLSTGEAADLLGTTPPTVRKMLVRKELTGWREDRGRRAWRVDRASVDRYVAEHGRFAGTRRPSRIAAIESEVAELRSAIGASGSAEELIRRDRDDLRATVVGLRESLARLQTVADLQAQADRERASMVEHLLAAVSAGERSDALRLRSIEELREAVAAASRPGHAGDLRAEGATG